MSDLDFEKMLAACNEDYKSAEEFGSDWMPDDGEYISTVVKQAKGVTTKGDQSFMWWKITGRIEDTANPTIDGKEFPIGFFRSTSMGFVKTGAKALNRGEPVNTLPEADAVFEGSLGLVLRVKIVTRNYTDKNGNPKEAKNCYVQEVLDTTDEAEYGLTEGEVTTE